MDFFHSDLLWDSATVGQFCLSLRKYILYLCAPGRFHGEDWDQIQVAGAILTQISISSTDYYDSEFKKGKSDTSQIKCSINTQR